MFFCFYSSQRVEELFRVFESSERFLCGVRGF